MNIRVRMLTGSANAQMKALRENLEKFDRAFKSVKKTSSGMGQIKIIGADQIKRMREGNVEVNKLQKNFASLRKNMQQVATAQGTIANRQYVGKNQIANVQVMNKEIQMLTGNLRVYKTVSAGVSKVRFVGASQSAELRRLNTMLETTARNQAQVAQGARATSSVPMVSRAQTAEVARLKAELQAVRRAQAAVQAQSAKGAAAAAMPVGGAGAGATRGTTAATAGMEGYTRAARKAQAAMVPTSVQQSRLVKWGSQLQWAGRQLQYNFTLPILLAGGLGMKFALDQEKAMTHVAKVYGDTADAVSYFQKQHNMSLSEAKAATKSTFDGELEALDRYFGALSEYYATNKAEVLEVAGSWAAAGASGVELAKSVENTLKTAQIGDMGAGEATKALISIQSQYGENAEGLARDLAYLNSVENSTGASMQDLIIGFQKTAAVARNGGIEVRYLAADIAALTPAYANAAEAGNAMKSLLGSLAKPTKPAAAAIKMLGYEVGSAEYESMNFQERLVGMAKNFKNLTSSQQQNVAVTIASKWQFSRFAGLMRELDSTTGNYAKALKSTANEQDSMNTAQRELDTILKSNPASLKRVGIALQNSLADIMQPLIPAIISLAKTVSDATHAFQDLPGPVQKAAMYFAIFLVIMPLMLRYVGAVAVLFGYLRIATVAAAGAVVMFSKASLLLLRFPFMVIAGLWARMMLMIGAAVGLGMKVIRISWLTNIAWMIMRWQAMFVALAVRTAISMMTLSALVAANWRTMLVRMGAMTIALLSSPWTLAIGVVLALLYVFKDDLLNIWNNIQRSFDGGYLAEIFGNMIRNIIGAFHALPTGIQNALIATVNMVRDAALQVYEWFSYLNPWAHHSPSLVENVQTGMKAVINEFSSLRQLEGYIKSAYRQMAVFGKATAGMMAASKRAAEASDRASIRKGAGAGAAKEYDKLIGKLHTLEVVYGKLGARIAKMEDALVIPMAKADQAIYENSYAQKQLQLQIAMTEKQYGDLSKAKEKLEALENEQAGLKELSTGLRQAGAGSDITKFYDDQIAALESQKQPISDNITKIDDLQKKLEELQSIGNILDLQKSVDFDPALRSIDVAKEKYDAVGEAIQRIKTTIGDATQAQQNLDAAISKKKEARKAKKAGGAAGKAGMAGGGADAGGNFGKVGGKGLEPRVDWSSQMDDINEQTDTLIANAGKTFGEINPFKSLSKWFKEQLDKIKGYMPDGKKIMNDIFGGGDAGKASEQLTSIGDKFKAFGDGFLDVMNGIGKAAKLVWKFIGPEVMDIVNAIVGAFKSMVTILGPEIAAWGTAIKPIATALWNLFKVVAAVVVLIVKLLLGIVGGALKPLLDGFFMLVKGISMVLRGALRFIAGIVNTIYYLFTGQWGKIGPAVLDIFKGMLEMIGGLFIGATGLLYGIIGGLVGGIVGLFKSIGRLIWMPIKWVIDKLVEGWAWLSDVLVGHSIIPDMIDAIVAVFKTLVSLAQWVWNNVLMPVINFFKAGFNAIVTAAKAVWGFIVGSWEVLKTLGQWVWDNVITPLATFWWNGVQFWLGILRGVWDGIKAAWEGLKTAGQWVWDNVISPVAAFFARGIQNIIDAAQAVWGRIKGAWNALMGAGKWVWDNVVSPFVERFTRGITNIVTGAGELFGKVKGAFSTLKDLGKWVWDNVLKPVYDKFKELFGNIETWITNNAKKITTPMAKMVNLVIGAINKMIDGLNMLSKLPGIDFKVSHIPPIELAAGGNIPTRRAGAGFKTAGARAIVGEGKANHPEYVVPTDPTYRNRAIGLYQSLGKRLGMVDDRGTPTMDGVPMYFKGGVLGGIGDAIGNAAGGIKNVAKGIKDTTVNIGGKAFDWAAGAAGNVASRIYSPVGKIVDALIGKIGSPLNEGGKAAHSQVKDVVFGTDQYMEALRKETGGKWAKPLKGGYSIGGGIGSYSGHNGQDFPVPGGTAVHAISGGKVTRSWDIGPKAGAKYNGGGYGSYGRAIEIQHSGGWKSLYAHNSSRGVEAGASVMPGQVIARSGSTGNSSGDHLHLSMWHNNALKAPLEALRSHGVEMASGGMVRASQGGMPAILAEKGRDELVTPLPPGFNINDLVGNNGGKTTIIHINGNLEFPNVTNGDDAQDFLDNLESVVKD